MRKTFLLLLIPVVIAGGLAVLVSRGSGETSFVYVRSGGFAGGSDRLEVDGEAKLTSTNAGETDERELGCPARIERVRDALEQVSLQEEGTRVFGPPPNVAVADAPQHDVVFGDIRIRGIGEFGPAWWKSLLRDLGSIIEDC